MRKVKDSLLRNSGFISSHLKGCGGKWMFGCHREGIVREFGKVVYTLLYSKWTNNKDIV